MIGSICKHFKPVVFSIIKFIYKYLMPVVFLILSIYLHNFFQISRLFIFIDKSSYYTLDISIYTAFFSMIFANIENCYKKKQLEINITYYKRGSKELFTDVCTLNINSEKYKRLIIQIMINGKINSKKENSIEFEFPNYVTVESDKDIFCGKINDNCLSINLKEIAKQKAGKDFMTAIELTFMQKAQSEVSSTVTGFLKNKTIMTSLNNKNKLRFEISKDD